MGNEISSLALRVSWVPIYLRDPLILSHLATIPSEIESCQHRDGELTCMDFHKIQRAPTTFLTF